MWHVIVAMQIRQKSAKQLKLSTKYPVPWLPRLFPNIHVTVPVWTLKSDPKSTPTVSTCKSSSNSLKITPAQTRDNPYKVKLTEADLLHFGQLALCYQHEINSQQLVFTPGRSQGFVNSNASWWKMISSPFWLALKNSFRFVTSPSLTLTICLLLDSTTLDFRTLVTELSLCGAFNDSQDRNVMVS